MKPKELFLSLAVFLVWMLASFLCHKLSNTAMTVYATATTISSSSSPTITPVVASLIVTLMQTLMCLFSVSVTSARDPLFPVMAVAHFLATWATNASLALTFASSTMAIKMLEPVTSALLQRLVLGAGPGGEGVMGMVMMVAGAAFYVGNPLSSADTGRAVTMAIISNLALGVRNVSVKLCHPPPSSSSSSSSSTSPRGIHLRSVSTLCCFVAASCALIGLASSGAAAAGRAWPPGSGRFLLLAAGSSAFHVLYSFASTNWVLLRMSVLGHALANILKRVAVILLLYLTGTRSASLGNWAGLALCTLGLLLYNRKKLMKTSSSSVDMPSTALRKGEIGNELPMSVPSRWRGGVLWRLLLPVGILFLLCVTTGPHVTSHLSSLVEGRPSMTSQEDSQAPDPYVGDLPSGVAEGLLRAAGPARQSEVRSPILRVFPRHHGNSTSDFAGNLRNGYSNWIDGRPLLSAPIEFQPEVQSMAAVRDFLSRRHLVKTPDDTDALSPYLTSSRDVVAEALRVQKNLFTDLLRGKKYALLFAMISNENKGDPAITVGTTRMLDEMGIKLLFYVNQNSCSDSRFTHAFNLAQQYPRERVVVLLQGGGDLFYHPADVCRGKGLRQFRGYKKIFLSESFFMKSKEESVLFAHKQYCCDPDLTILLRDRQALAIARRLFTNGTTLLLAPDMAFQNGVQARFAPPYYDVAWLHRVDGENPFLKTVPRLGANVSVTVWDWNTIASLKGDNSMRQSVNAFRMGLGLLLQGRVVVTDRLHGHILCVLLDVPHVLLDNYMYKMSSFHNTWTRGLKNCRLAATGEDAAAMALELLREYKDSLPKTFTAAHIDEKIFAPKTKDASPDKTIPDSALTPDLPGLGGFPCDWTPQSLVTPLRSQPFFPSCAALAPALSFRSVASDVTPSVTSLGANDTACLKRFVRENCTASGTRIPKVAHYVRYGAFNLTLEGFLSAVSVARFLRPCVILYHSDVIPHGPYWRALLHLVPNLLHVQSSRPKEIHGHVIKKVEHSSDVTRIRLMIEYGGVYLDNDYLVLRSLDELLKEQVVLGMEIKGHSLCNGFLMSEAHSPFMRRWMANYTDFNDTQWGEHSVLRPYKLARDFPHLVTVKNTLHRPHYGQIAKFLNRTLVPSFDWQRNHGLHLYTRQIRTKFNAQRIDRQDNVIGDIARHILYSDEHACLRHK